MPKGYQPTYKRAVFGLGNGVDIDIKAMEANQQLHAYTVLQQNTKIISFEPHLHAPGQRMCLEAIWGYNIQTLNCVGYDHNWVRSYQYDENYAPLLPKGTILKMTGWLDNSAKNANVIEPRTREDRGSLPGRQQICLLGDVLQRRPLDSAPRQHCADRKHQADREHDHEYGRHEQVRPQRAAPSCITCSGWR